MKHPMLIVAGLYVLGVLLGEWVPQPIGWLLGAGLALDFEVVRALPEEHGVIGWRPAGEFVDLE